MVRRALPVFKVLGSIPRTKRKEKKKLLLMMQVQAQPGPFHDFWRHTHTHTHILKGWDIAQCNGSGSGRKGRNEGRGPEM